MTISYVSSGTVGLSTGAPSPGLPTGMVAGDVMILTAEDAGTSLGTISGWTVMTATVAGVAESVTGLRSTVAWRAWQSGDVAPSIIDSGDHTRVQIHAFRGLDLTTPLSSTFNSQTTAALSHAAGTGTMTTTAKQAVLMVGANSLNQTLSYTSGSLGSGGVDIGTISPHSTGNGGVQRVTFFDASALGSPGSFTAPLLTYTAASSSTFIAQTLKMNPLPEPHTIGGVLGAVTGAASVQQTDNVTVAGTPGKVSGAASVSLGSNIAAAGAVGSVFGEAHILENYNVAVAGLTKAITGSAGVELTEVINVAGILGHVWASAEVGHVNQLVLGASLSAVSGAASVQSDSSFNVIVDGSIAPVRGAATVAFIEQLSISGTVPAVFGAADISMEPPSQSVISVGVLRRFSALAAVDIQTDQCYAVADDQRERILARLEAVLANVPGIGTFGRNDPSVPESLLPGLVLLDADESAKEDTFGRGRPARGPNVIEMRPELYLMVEDSTADAVGASLNAYLQLICSAVLRDTELRALCHNGDIRFEGSMMNVESGRRLLGEMSIQFSFNYALKTEPPCEDAGDYEVVGNDSRERILNALSTVLANVEGVDTFLHNDLSVPESHPNTVILLDGDEDADPDAFGRGRPAYSPNTVMMNPEIYIIAGTDPDRIGPDLNQLRLMVVRAILNDAVLQTLVVDGDIRYEGCQTALALGRAMTGEMGMTMSMNRLLTP